MSLVTLVVMPEEPVRFGVLTFLGTAALLTVPLRPLLARIPPRLGLILSFSLFLLARDVNHGYLGFAWVPLLRLPRGWYTNLATAGLGFPAPTFASSDYFALLPWLFLFWTGFYLYRLRPEIPGPAGYSPAGAVRYKPSLSAALSAASAGAVRRAGAAAHHFVRRSFLCPIN